ncbi:hypothetical protein FRC16_003219 [Serendipita sp. 398]|nr:hypothetical protein FRC16_003219 [Serendipita sp. 398]
MFLGGFFLSLLFASTSLAIPLGNHNDPNILCPHHKCSFSRLNVKFDPSVLAEKLKEDGLLAYMCDALRPATLYAKCPFSPGQEKIEIKVLGSTIHYDLKTTPTGYSNSYSQTLTVVEKDSRYQTGSA